MSLFKGVVVTAALALVTSCGGTAGDDSGDSHGLTLSLTKPGTSFAPGEVIELAIVDGPRTGTFEAHVDSLDVVIALDPDKGDLVAFTPAVDPGAHNLIVTNGDTRAIVPLGIASYERIADSQMYVEDLVASIDASLASAAAQETNADALAMIADHRAQLAMASAQLSALTPAERDVVAYAVREMVSAQPTAHSLPLECPETMDLVTKQQSLAAAVGAVAIGLVATYIPGAQLFGGVVAGIGLGYILANVSEAKQLVATIVNKCVVPDSLLLGDASFAPATTLQFEHNVPKSVGVSTSYVVDLGAKNAILAMKQTVMEISQKFPGNWLAGFPASEEPVTKSGAPSGVTLMTSGFEGTMQPSGMSLSFTFKFPTEMQAGQPEPFTFALTYGMGRTSSFNATLAPKCDAPRLLCSTGCFDSSDQNCGSCGNVCLSGKHCVSDSCQCTDPTPVLCNGGCKVSCP